MNSVRTVCDGWKTIVSSADFKLTLSLFVLRVLADDPDAALSLDDLALLTDRFYWWSNLHWLILLSPFVLCFLNFWAKKDTERVSPRKLVYQYNTGFWKMQAIFSLIFRVFTHFSVSSTIWAVSPSFWFSSGVFYLFRNYFSSRALLSWPATTLISRSMQNFDQNLFRNLVFLKNHR